MKKYGLIGFPLKHSFSSGFFNEKFGREEIHAEYLNFEIDDIQKVEAIISDNPHLKGLNVTIPYKESILPFLDEISEVAQKIGAVNVVKIKRSEKTDKPILKGYNTDYIGFKNSIQPLLNPEIHQYGLILGTGGASKAVAQALSDIGIEWKYVSRSKDINRFTYEELDETIIARHTVIVNASPIGTFPHIDESPAIPYQFLTPNHLLYDLVYNPAETQFLKNGKRKGATIKNGYEMLQLQALAAWEIWSNI